MTRSQWDRRISRATELTSTCPFAAEGLHFYTRIATFQRNLYTGLGQASVNFPSAIPSAGSLRNELNLPFLLPKFPEFLSAIQQFAPAPLGQSADRLAQRGSSGWQRALEDFWYGEMESPAGLVHAEEDRAGDSSAAPSERWLAWIFLQPYAEYFANQRAPMTLHGTPSTCPLCGARPIVGVLRSKGDGAEKSLVCMLCSHEWVFRRIYCPACGEEREPQMAFYSAPEIAHVRVDVCDTCHTYLKSIDLTKTGLAVPVVDELAAIPLDLWARQHGYEKLQINLLGT